MKSFVSKFKWWHILPILFVLSFIPFPTELIPEIKFQAVDEQNQILSNVYAEQSWQSYTFFGVKGFDEKCTDLNGTVIFPQRLLWASSFSRIVSPVLAQASTLAHGSTGTTSFVRIFDRNYISDYQYWREDETFYQRERKDKLPNLVIAKASNVINAKNCK